MLSFRFFTSAARGVTAVSSNQLSSSVGPQPCPVPMGSKGQENISETFCRPTSSTNARRLTTASTHSQAERISKIKKINDVLSQANIDLPNRPKKPVTPWIMFVRERKDQVIAEHGSKMSAAEISKILAKEWQRIDKSRYENEYKRLHQDYERRIKAYEDALTDEQLDLIGFQKEAKRESRAMKQLKKTGPPVMPRNPANLYCHVRSKQDDFKELLKTKRPPEVFKEIFQEYRSLSDSEKQKYLAMQEEDKSRFQQEFLAWFEGVQNNENLTKAVREQANQMRERLRALKYI